MVRHRSGIVTDHSGIVPTDSGIVTSDSGQALKLGTIDRNGWARWTGMAGHDGPESVGTMDRNTHRDVYADRGYPSAEREKSLRQAGWRVQIQRKGTAQRAISAPQKQRNRRIATPRARIEHVFGAFAQMGGKLVRCNGIIRATLSLHLKAAAYNLKRLVFLKESGLQTF